MIIRNISYCFEWNSILNKPIKQYKLYEAEKRHNNGEKYCAVIEVETGERITIECNSDFFYVLFYDIKNRRSLSYKFEKISETKLFLWNVWLPHYKGETNTIENAEVYNFKENGEVKIIIGEPKGRNRQESVFIQNVEKNYSVIPSFGNYESIIKKER